MTTAKKLIGLLAIFLATTACGSPKNDMQRFYDSGTNSNDDSTETYNCSMAAGTYTAAIAFPKSIKHGVPDTCEIEVADCKVVRIYFLQHRLDETNMKPSAINSDGNALVVDKKGAKYKVHILSAPKEDTYTYRSRNNSHRSKNNNSSGSHLCGHLTKKGTPCQRHVTNGHYCWQHGG